MAKNDLRFVDKSKNTFSPNFLAFLRVTLLLKVCFEGGPLFILVSYDLLKEFRLIILE